MPYALRDNDVRNSHIGLGHIEIWTENREPLSLSSNSPPHLRQLIKIPHRRSSVLAHFGEQRNFA